MNIVIFGLSLTSSWGNGHATTYRSLVRGLCDQGHHVLFLERNVPWYADNRDLPNPPYGSVALYDSFEQVEQVYAEQVAAADLVLIGSYVPEAITVAEWVLTQASGVTAFYDIDTPVTLSKLANDDCEYLTPELIPRFDLYFTFAGGKAADELEDIYHARKVEVLYCSVDPHLYAPVSRPLSYDLGYLGTYSTDRQPVLHRLLIQPAQRLPQQAFCVAGPQYPESIKWPANVTRIEHLSPQHHRDFYCGCRFTLNVTRADMVTSGYSPSVRLFEAAACGTPIISDAWAGLETIFEPEREILIASHADDVQRYLTDITPSQAREIGERARMKVLTQHTGVRRAIQLEQAVSEVSQKDVAY